MSKNTHFPTPMFPSQTLKDKITHTHLKSSQNVSYLFTPLSPYT